MYETIYTQLEGLIGDERNFIANASAMASLLYTNLEGINWVGFYMATGSDLIVGPYQGKPACVRIASGKGVCGAAAAARQTIVVADVHRFQGHIPCDAASNSEIVVPLLKHGYLYGVMDIDSPLFARFSSEDRLWLESLARLLVERSDMAAAWDYYNR